MRAQEEIFAYSAVEGVYGSSGDGKSAYELFVALVEAFMKDVGAKLDVRKPVKIDVTEKIGEGKKGRVTWSIAYTVPKAVRLDAAQLDKWKFLQGADRGT